VSSILEALRELEGDRPPATRREIPPPEKPSILQRLGGILIPILGGLAVGVVAFGIWAWGPRAAPSEPAPPVATATPPAPAAEAAGPDRPAWLDTAEPPRARFGRNAAPAAERAVPADRPAPAGRAASPPARAASDDAASAPAPADTPAEKPGASGGQVVVESISYAASPEQRIVTMRIHGRRVTLRQRESVDGVEVQLIMPNGVYLQRGGEVYLMPLSR